MKKLLGYVAIVALSVGLAAAQNAGATTGEGQWDAQITTTGLERFSVFFPHQMDHAPTTITYYNPSAANGNCRDETAAGDGGSHPGRCYMGAGPLDSRPCGCYADLCLDGMR